jgi:spore coat polysaccharide biosynthesis predicted glycosyltransferase SpsG
VFEAVSFAEDQFVKKRLVFRIIGNKQVGMGHIYRALTLAREFSEYEVLFVTDLANQIVVESLLKEDYWVGVYAASDVTKQIRSLKPDAVIYDALDTSRRDVEEVRRSGAVVISFEDLGDGAHHTNLTINELFDKSQFEGDHILWGHDYFFLRDEFETVQTHRFEESVDGVMLAFGGTDQHNLSQMVFRAIKGQHDAVYTFLETMRLYRFEFIPEKKIVVAPKNVVALKLRFIEKFIDRKIGMMRTIS